MSSGESVRSGDRPRGRGAVTPVSAAARVALVTEGTYPHAHGGVSVWCDQLVRGLGSHRFDIHAIVGTGREALAWDLPPNVDRLVTVPLWGPERPQHPTRRTRREFPEVFERFVVSLSPEGSPGATGRALQEMHHFAKAGQLAAGLRTDDALDIVMAFMAGHRTADRPVTAAVHTAALAEACEALTLLEHFLRPLGSPVPRTDLCQSAANGLGALVGLTAKWRHNTPLILTEHGIYLRERMLAHAPGTMSHAKRLLVFAFFRRLTQVAYRAADVVAPGSDYNRRWEHFEGVDESRIQRIYNGIEPTDFPLAVDEPDTPTLSWIGRINPLKDPKTMLRAFARVVEEVPDARLRIFGSAPTGDEGYRDECLELLDDLGLTGRAVFEGRVPDAVDAYHAGQVVVLTSISEGFPYAVIEAMSCGRPTVATDVGGVGEAVVDPSLLAPARDDAALAEVCIRLLRDPELRRDLGRRGRERAVELFTVANCVEQHEALYRDLVGSRR